MPPDRDVRDQRISEIDDGEGEAVATSHHISMPLAMWDLGQVLWSRICLPPVLCVSLADEMRSLHRLRYSATKRSARERGL
jgi:hypothetical protein